MEKNTKMQHISPHIFLSDDSSRSTWMALSNAKRGSQRPLIKCHWERGPLPLQWLKHFLTVGYLCHLLEDPGQGQNILREMSRWKPGRKIWWLKHQVPRGLSEGRDAFWCSYRSGNPLSSAVSGVPFGLFTCKWNTLWLPAHFSFLYTNGF